MLHLKKYIFINKNEKIVIYINHWNNTLGFINLFDQYGFTFHYQEKMCLRVVLTESSVIGYKLKKLLIRKYSLMNQENLLVFITERKRIKCCCLIQTTPIKMIIKFSIAPKIIKDALYEIHWSAVKFSCINGQLKNILLYIYFK
jgi:hypothetical protein